MSIRFLVISAAFLAFSAEASRLESRTGMKAMERALVRSDETHTQSMASIMETMSLQKAWQVLEKGNLTSPALIQMASHTHGKKAHLRKTAPAGYAGVEGARKLLNDLIYESKSKYDSEKAKCSEYYGQQCTAMEANREQISSANYLAANSRALILDSQATISKCQEHIPAAKTQLEHVILMTKHEKQKMRTRLNLIEKDIKALDDILQLTTCKATDLLQTQKYALLHCEDPCDKSTSISFKDEELNQKVGKLQSEVSHGLLQSGFKDMLQEGQSEEAPEFMQVDAHRYTPRTAYPGAPCDDPTGGVPTMRKRAKKCSISDSKDCDKIREKFLGIQAGIKDEKYGIESQIQRIEKHRDETKATLESEIQNDQDMLNDGQTKLASATSKEARSQEDARQTAKENKELNDDLKDMMKSCRKNYQQFESEECALKKIRGGLYKMQGTAVKVFTDCALSKWQEEECTKECGGGQQQLVRGILIHPDGGAKCLPLTAMKTCNAKSCPVDCKMDPWGGWSKCSAECGGGVQQRLREVTVPMKHAGKPCDPDSETRACNAQACEKDCDLTEWTAWGTCSKQCNGGTQKREKYIAHAPTGQGECAGPWSQKRLQYKKCNQMECLSSKSPICSTYIKDQALYDCATVPPCCRGYKPMGTTDQTVQCVPSDWSTDGYAAQCPGKPMPCKDELDIVFLLDGSGSLGQEGWNAEIKTLNTFVDAFAVQGGKAEMSVILYSGPRTWGGVRKCFRRHSGVNLETYCKIKTVTHLEKNMATVKTAVAGLTWPKGSTLTSLALQSAKAELQSAGRKNSKSVVVVITDGRPISYRKTRWSSYSVRKVARLVWVPVTRYAPLRSIRRWATRRWQENVVPVKSFKDLNSDVVTQVVANICPMEA